MQTLNRTTAGVASPPPERVLQFGGGNFLRGFAGWILDVYNQQSERPLGVVVANNSDREIYRRWREQEGLYHVLTKGIRNGELVDRYDLITNVSRVLSLDRDWASFLRTAENPDMRYVLSNTTEAGIRFSAEDAGDDAPPAEFPAKLTRWLHRRFDHFGGASERGCVILPMELLVDNGRVLREKVLRYADHWKLGHAFSRWVNEACIFCNTLVDRIVPGVGKQEEAAALATVGFDDAAITQGEPYHLLAVDAPPSVREELPLDRLGLNIVYTDDLTPYRRSKVSVLNGTHTAMVPVGYLCGRETVRETLEDELTGNFVRAVVFEEILPTLDLPGVDLEQFARDVLDRFRNPFIHHRLLSISLNSVTKFRERVLPTMLAYHDRRGEWPPRLVLSLAALIRFYRGDFRDGTIPLKDDHWAIEFMQSAWSESEDADALARRVLGWERAWGRDLTAHDGLHQVLSDTLHRIEAVGVPGAVRHLHQS
ncbi:tagaturonate reductase [Lewinella sp. JB7]|uniref:tagaturonate reductase n=1 Tax=Lewinella sp. JB7 TaxID=2962887 RepID=UPI0020C9EE64|nr:tagaturonate reductase [Lewinella sp. JB7]MCP9236124.1 tagaturonate reductase [Lewinella sp. JB7]